MNLYIVNPIGHGVPVHVCAHACTYVFLCVEARALLYVSFLWKAVHLTLRKGFTGLELSF